MTAGQYLVVLVVCLAGLFVVGLIVQKTKSRAKTDTVALLLTDIEQVLDEYLPNYQARRRGDKIHISQNAKIVMIVQFDNKDTTFVLDNTPIVSLKNRPKKSRLIQIFGDNGLILVN